MMGTTGTTSLTKKNKAKALSMVDNLWVGCRHIDSMSEDNNLATAFVVGNNHLIGNLINSFQ